MYQQILHICSTKTKTSGPGIDPDVFFSNPAYQQEAIECLTSVPRKEYSCYISRVMDRLGYSYEMIKYRQQMYEEVGNLFSRYEKVVTTGGKGEGTSLLFESDVDAMRICHGVICAGNPEDFIHNEGITLFQTERHEASPGYTRLKLLRMEESVPSEFIRQLLIQSESGSYYLSSQFLTDTIKKNVNVNVNFGATAGPSTPTSTEAMDFDNVFCFRCVCPDILERWVHRRRYYGWPSPDTIHQISLLDGHVVPVGFKGSQTRYIEWRVCYSLAELHLMRNLNESQLKVYILLKKLSKSVLKPVCEDMTSYIMKNVVLWLCEANGVDRFTPDLLMDRLLDCLIYLRACVRENNLPSYMIPDRNLLAGRQDIQQIEELSSLLNDILREGGRMLLRCDKIRDTMLVQDMIPYMFREVMEKRDKIESLMIMRIKIRSEMIRPEMSIEELKQQVSQDAQACDIFTHLRLLIPSEQFGKTDVRQLRLYQLLS